MSATLIGRAFQDAIQATFATGSASLRERLIESLPDPLENQIPILESGARFKVLRCGRRFGKSRFAMLAGLAGHGPVMGGEPLFRGVAQGMDVVWVAQDYPNLSTVMWREEFLPRFQDMPGATTNSNEHFVTFEGLGTMYLRPETAISGIRGIGKRLGGVVLDEAAWFDLEGALRSVILPALMDNEGWLILMSTTNAAHDGNPDKRVPSYFNLICEQIRDGQRTSEWQEFYGTAHDNPTLSEKAITDLVAEYPAGSRDLEQEVYAKLLEGGAGFAFSEWNKDVHIRRYEPPKDGTWYWFAGLDWGYRSPGAFYLMAEGPDGDIAVRWEYYFRERTAYDVGKEVGRQLLARHIPNWIAYDSAMDAMTDGAQTQIREVERGLTDAMKTLAPTLIPSPKGPESRGARKMQMHEYLKWSEVNGEVKPWTRPKLTVHPDCPHLIRTLPKLLIDPKKPEAVGKEQEDHAYDSVSYALMVRRPPKPPPEPDVTPDRWAGVKDGRRVRQQAYWKSRLDVEPAGMNYSVPGARDDEWEEG